MIGERILRALSRPPSDVDHTPSASERDVLDPLHLLRRVYPDLEALVASRRVLDFGCGQGHQCIALVRELSCSVVGLDTNEATLANARRNAALQGIPSDRLSLLTSVPSGLHTGFDVVISQNAFEHFGNPEEALGEMSTMLRAGGVLLLTFGPPWYAPYGNHMYFFSKVPWMNLLFSERTVMNVRRSYRSDNARRYEEVESGLNRMTIARFERIVRRSDLHLRRVNYECVRKMNWLARPPVLRELFINHVSVVLERPA